MVVTTFRKSSVGIRISGGTDSLYVCIFQLSFRWICNDEVVQKSDGPLLSSKNTVEGTIVLSGEGKLMVSSMV